ncbi:hypothetical protein [Marispirochaeta aestuarii]|uniref:hypothetical protein n=1 Tax=Marispirochaeta aestuarii TaxID=1963862 RepID=UPI0029C77517|nr:hypothetical protein [Marispirochaeta aestuarii]
MPWKEKTVMDQKQESILLWKAGKHTVTALCEIFSIIRSTGCKFINHTNILDLLDYRNGPLNLIAFLARQPFD